MIDFRAIWNRHECRFNQADKTKPAKTESIEIATVNAIQFSPLVNHFPNNEIEGSNL